MRKLETKICKKHGECGHILENSGYYRCRKCRLENVYRSRKNQKRKLVEYFGGECVVCGYNKCQEALQFHHIDPTKKEFGIAETGCTRSWARVVTEAKKCVLVCGNCHVEIEYGITVLK